MWCVRNGDERHEQKEKKDKEDVATDNSPCVNGQVNGQTGGSLRDSEHEKTRKVTWKDIVIGKGHVSKG